MTQSHEALRGEHRLQNVELLREQIEPLAYLLNDDARTGKCRFAVLSFLIVSSLLFCHRRAQVILCVIIFLSFIALGVFCF